MKLSAVHAELISQIGVHEAPANSNCQPYSHDLGRPCESWCCDFIVAELHRKMGMALPSTTAAVNDMLNAARRQGRLSPVPLDGSLPIYHFPGEHAGGNHIGWLEPGGIALRSIIDIEGNTAYGNDRNGGTVMRRTRNRSLIIGYVRLDYDPEDQPMPVPSSPQEAFYVPSDHQVEIDLVQEALHYPNLIHGIGPTGRPFREYALVIFDQTKGVPNPKPGSFGVGTNITGWAQVSGPDRYATRLLFLSLIDMH